MQQLRWISSIEQHHRFGTDWVKRLVEWTNYLDFLNTQLLVKVKLTRGNGVDITDADHVGGVNMFLRSLFQQVDVSLNDVQVSQSSGTYAFSDFGD